MGDQKPVKDPQRITVPLPNGFKLVAEAGNDMDYPEIFVGILADDGVWYQDLTIVRNAYHWEEDKPGPVLDEGKYEVLVFGNENDEDYTESFEIEQYHEEA